MPAVEQDIADRVADLARGAQRAGVVAVREQAAAALEQRVDPTCEANSEALHAAREGGLAGGLDDQVEVVAEDVEVDDAEVAAMTAGGDRGPHDAHDALAPQRRQAADDPQGDVDRRARREAWAWCVGVRRRAAGPAGAGAPAAATGRATGLIQRELDGPSGSPYARH